jgi:hypothetical protein
MKISRFGCLSFWVVCFLAFSQPVAAQVFLRAEGTKIVNDEGEVLLRGMGLGGWVLQEPYMLQLSGIARTQTQIRDKISELIGEEATDAFYESWINNGVTREDIDSLASWGFNSIRFPMHYNLFTLPVEGERIEGENTWMEKGFILTDSLLSWCKANRIYLILDLHAAPGGQGNDMAISDASEVRLWESEENKQKTVALWRKIAERYAGEEWIGGYDIINEPNYGFESATDKNGCSESSNQPLRELLIRITHAIREVDHKHLIVIEGNCWGNNYNGIFPLWDDNMVISFHKYWNYNDENEIAFILDSREQNQAPVWLSESGENSNAWFTDAIRLVESHGIGWCWWTYKRMGLTCPMTVGEPEEYALIKQYWRGKAAKPSRETALRVFRQLAENYKIEHTVFHKDYIDALFRQVVTEASLPFEKHYLPATEPLVVFASDYDMGRSGFAYHDKDSANYHTSTQISTSWNKGECYRNDGVDIFECQDERSNGYCVGHTEAGEWLQYTVEVEKASACTVVIRASAAGRFYLTVNGEKTESVVVQSGNEWKDFELKDLSLKTGKNIIRIYIEEGGVDINYMKLAVPASDCK